MIDTYASIIGKLGGTIRNPREPLSEEQMLKIEARMGCSLPADYREFAQFYSEVLLGNATHRRGSISFLYGAVAPTSEIISADINELPFYGEPTIQIEWAPNIRNVIEIEDNATEVDYPPRELEPIGLDAGNSGIFLALAGKQPGAIFFWHLWHDIYHIADSFDDFMHSLEAG